MDPETFTTSDGAVLHYEDSKSESSADPLLLLHGLTGTHDDWQHVFDIDVMELLDHLAIERARAVGMSLGAKTLLHLATAAPSRMAVMVLVSATPRFPEATRALFRAAAAAPRSESEWAAMSANHPQGDAAIQALWSLPARFADDASDMQFGPERLALVQAPTLLVAGDRDPLYPIELAVELYRGIPQASLYVVPGGGDRRQLFLPVSDN